MCIYYVIGGNHGARARHELFLTYGGQLYNECEAWVYAGLTKLEIKTVAWGHNLDQEYRKGMSTIDRVRACHKLLEENNFERSVELKHECVEEGRLRLIDPVAKFIPAFARTPVLGPYGKLSPQLRPMLVRDLLTHTSGLTYGFLDDSPVHKDYWRAKLVDARVSLAEGIEDLATLPLAFQPGERFHYSVGIDVAARVIEVVSGQPLRGFLHERLFAPLGMTDTDFGVAVGKRDRLAAMYGRPDAIAGVTMGQALAMWREGHNARVDVSTSYPVDRPETFQRGGHGLFGTLADYFRFAQMLCSGGAGIVGRKTLELMHMNHLAPALMPIEIGGLPLAGYGFGLGSRVLLDPAASGVSGTAGEFGWSGAAKTYFWVDPKERVVGLFATQSMLSFDLPESDLRAIVYGALD